MGDTVKRSKKDEDTVGIWRYLALGLLGLVCVALFVLLVIRQGWVFSLAWLSVGLLIGGYAGFLAWALAEPRDREREREPETCGNCQYHAVVYEHICRRVLCRRRAPHAQYGHPEVESRHWCGEWKGEK